MILVGVEIRNQGWVSRQGSGLRLVSSFMMEVKVGVMTGWIGFRDEDKGQGLFWGMSRGRVSESESGFKTTTLTPILKPYPDSRLET